MKKGVFKKADLALLVDRKGRKQIIRLEVDGELQSHYGIVSHNKIIGADYGTDVASNSGGAFIVFKPTLSDYLLDMKRGAQIIYPKDLGHILFIADISPGMKVFESGIGSGALSLALLQQGAQVVGYENRKDHIAIAEKNITDFIGKDIFQKRYEVCEKDSYEGIEHDNFDRAILDLPEPFRVVKHLNKSLKLGSILLAYTPSIIQASQFRESLHAANFFGTETIEVLYRSWHIVDKSIRPDHKMIGHTGFLTYARKR